MTVQTKNKKVELVEYQKMKSADNAALSECCPASLEKYLNRNKLTSVLKVTPSGIKADSYVGVIKFKNTQFEILPKLISKMNSDDKIDDEERVKILNNLIFMLSYTKNLSINTGENAKLAKTSNPFLEVLIREFANSLFDALKRLTPKNYIRMEDNLKFLKGKLKFTENIKYNCTNQARFYCEYDEYSEDCVLNQLFYYVSVCLYSVSKDNKNKQILKKIIDYFCDLKLVKFNKAKCDKIKLTRQQQMYKKPFGLAKMFIEHSSVDLSRNKFENITLTWDMNVLFEEFIYQVIKRKIKNDQIDYVKAQKRKDLLKNKKRLTKADIIVYKKDKSKVIIDTKYKRLRSFEDVSSHDLYQVGMYCFLHDDNSESPRAVLLYPKYPGYDFEHDDYYNSLVKEYSVSIKIVDMMQENLKADLNSANSKIVERLENIICPKLT